MAAEPSGICCSRVPGTCIYMGLRHRVVFFFFFQRVNGNCLLKTPKGVIGPEGSEPPERLVDTAQSCLRRFDPAWRRPFILPLGCSCFLSSLHLNKQIQNVICSQTESAKIPQGTGDSPEQGKERGSEQETCLHCFSLPVHQII